MDTTHPNNDVSGNYKMMTYMLRTTLTIATLLLLTPFLTAQETQTTRGIEGHMDGHGRSPQLSVTRANKGDNIVSLLVDAFNPDDAYNIYFMEFEFWINRHSYARQIRYPGLTGAVGVDVNTLEIPLPFSYVVTAKLVTPNRTYTTSISGAFFSNNLVAELDCDVTLSAALAGETTVFSASDISTSQSGDNDIVLTFTASSDEGSTMDVSGVVTVNTSNQTASSTLRLVRNDIPQLVATNGSVTIDDDDEISSLELSSEDGSVTMSCD